MGPGSFDKYPRVSAGDWWHMTVMPTGAGNVYDDSLFLSLLRLEPRDNYWTQHTFTAPAGGGRGSNSAVCCGAWGSWPRTCTPWPAPGGSHYQWSPHSASWRGSCPLSAPRSDSAPSRTPGHLNTALRKQLDDDAGHLNFQACFLSAFRVLTGTNGRVSPDCPLWLLLDHLPPRQMHSSLPGL